MPQFTKSSEHVRLRASRAFQTVQTGAPDLSHARKAGPFGIRSFRLSSEPFGLKDFRNFNESIQNTFLNVIKTVEISTWILFLDQGNWIDVFFFLHYSECKWHHFVTLKYNGSRRNIFNQEN
jgi:hypothetical protein